MSVTKSPLLTSLLFLSFRSVLSSYPTPNDKIRVTGPFEKDYSTTTLFWDLFHPLTTFLTPSFSPLVVHVFEIPFHGNRTNVLSPSTTPTSSLHPLLVRLGSSLPILILSSYLSRGLRFPCDTSKNYLRFLLIPQNPDILER